MGDLIRRAGDLKDRSDFERLLSERFPSIAAEVNDVERGLLHLEMAVLARATCRAVDVGDSHQIQAHIGFVDELLSDAGPDLENAIYVSYLENVFLSSKDPRYMSARAMLSKRLETALAKLEEHWKKIAEWNMRQDR